MMKKLLLLGLILFATSAFAEIDTFEGEAVTTATEIEGCASCDTVDGQTVTSGGAASIEDDFSGTLAKWTGLTGGTYTIGSGVVSSPTEGSTIIYTDAQTSGLTQVLQAKWATVGNYNGFYFRSTNNSGEKAYALRFSTAQDWEWRYCTGHSCTTIQQSDVPDSGSDFNPDAGDYVTMKVDGTGDNVVVSVWECEATPCDLASLGAATFTLADNPGANNCDTGKYVGLYNGSSTSQDFDDFEAE